MPAVRRVVIELPRCYLPRRANLPVYDQHGPSCVGNGSALAATVDQRRDHRRTLVYDGDGFYEDVKKIDGHPNVAGTWPRIAHKLRQEQGIRVAQSRLAREVGEHDVIAAYARLVSLDEIHAAIYLFGTAGLGLMWKNTWGWDGPVPADGMLPEGGNDIGGHYFDGMGWCAHREADVIQNSWSKGWGVTIAGTPGRAWLPWRAIRGELYDVWRTIDLQDD